MTWQTRRAKRVAIDRAEIRRRSRRLGPFMEGCRAGREVNQGAVPRACPYSRETQEAEDWKMGYFDMQEKYDGEV